MPPLEIDTEADRLLLLFYQRHPKPSDSDLAAWCAKHPRHAKDLRAFADFLRRFINFRDYPPHEETFEPIVHALFDAKRGQVSEADLVECAFAHPKYAKEILLYAPLLDQVNHWPAEPAELSAEDTASVARSAAAFRRFHRITFAAALAAAPEHGR